MTDLNTGNGGGPIAVSSRTLLRSTLIAAAAAAAILLVAVLPAEYGVDPTGIGRALNLTPMGEIKMRLAREAAAAETAAGETVATPATPPPQASVAAAPPAHASPSATPPASASPTPAPPADGIANSRADTVTLTLRPGQGREVKLVMRKGSRVQYAWSATGGAVNFEAHGDTLRAPPGVFHSYKKGRDAREDAGQIVAVFDGLHGWFWRNRSSAAVTITLRTEGEYQELKRMD